MFAWFSIVRKSDLRMSSPQGHVYNKLGARLSRGALTLPGLAAGVGRRLGFQTWGCLPATAETPALEAPDHAPYASPELPRVPADAQARVWRMASSPPPGRALVSSLD